MMIISVITIKGLSISKDSFRAVRCDQNRHVLGNRTARSGKGQVGTLRAVVLINPASLARCLRMKSS